MADNDEKELTIVEKIDNLIPNLTQDDTGNWISPEGTSEELSLAAVAEKRRRDTQASRQDMKVLLDTEKAKSAALVKRMEGNLTITLNADEAKELDTLKLSDPEAYHEKMMEHKEKARLKLADTLTEVNKDSAVAGELDSRIEILKRFNESNPTLNITDEFIESEIPPRITKRLSTGKITFGEFLNEVKEYVSKNKVLGDGNADPTDINMGDLGGSPKPADKAVGEDIVASYAKEVY